MTSAQLWTCRYCDEGFADKRDRDGHVTRCAFGPLAPNPSPPTEGTPGGEPAKSFLDLDDATLEAQLRAEAEAQGFPLDEALRTLGTMLPDRLPAESARIAHEHIRAAIKAFPGDEGDDAIVSDLVRAGTRPYRRDVVISSPAKEREDALADQLAAEVVKRVTITDLLTGLARQARALLDDERDNTPPESAVSCPFCGEQWDLGDDDEGPEMHDEGCPLEAAEKFLGGPVRDTFDDDDSQEEDGDAV